MVSNDIHINNIVPGFEVSAMILTSIVSPDTGVDIDDIDTKIHWSILILRF